MARYQTENARFEMWLESQKAEKRKEQAALEQAETMKMAEESKEASDNLREEIEQASISTQNNIYLGILLIFAIGLVVYIIRKSKREETMQDSQKFGVVTIIGSALTIVFAIVISDNWSHRLDFLQNLMSTLRVKLFLDESNAYLIDMPTKYIVLFCICIAAYGLTTYLGITPTPKIKAQKIDGADTAI